MLFEPADNRHVAPANIARGALESGQSTDHIRDTYEFLAVHTGAKAGLQFLESTGVGRRKASENEIKVFGSAVSQCRLEGRRPTCKRLSEARLEQVLNGRPDTLIFRRTDQF
jgi:hypothetical protein